LHTPDLSHLHSHTDSLRCTKLCLSATWVLVMSVHLSVNLQAGIIWRQIQDHMVFTSR